MDASNRPRMTISVEETASLLGVSRWLAYDQIQRGELPAVRVGRRLRVPVRPLLALVGMTWEDWLTAEQPVRSA